MVTGEHNSSSSGTNSDSTMMRTGASCNSCNSCNSSDSTIVSRTDLTSESSASLIPNWKDDGDDSICTSINNNGDDDIENDAESYVFHRIPRILEFTLLKGELDGEGEDHSLFSPSSVSFSQHSPHSLSAEEDFPSLPVISMPPGSRLEKVHSNRVVVVDQVPTNIASAERRNSFRRRLQNAENGSVGANPLSESKSPSPPLSPSTRSGCTIYSRPRFVLAFGAMVLVMLSVHENIKNSRQRYRQLYQLRREEIAFPLVQAQYYGATGNTDRVTLIEEGNKVGGDHHLRKAELPKFYFPKVDQSNTNWIRGSSSSGRYGSHLAMARPQQQRPIFVPDVPLPDGGFQKPLKRFVFDSQEREQKEGQQQSERQVLDNDSSSSWTSWMASLALIGMLFDTGWKEYRKYRINAIPSSRDE